jgi:hypothetical protein
MPSDEAGNTTELRELIALLSALSKGVIPYVATRSQIAWVFQPAICSNF